MSHIILYVIRVCTQIYFSGRRRARTRDANRKFSKCLPRTIAVSILTKDNDA